MRTTLRCAAAASAAAVGLQVLLPRVFSVVLWYHLGFFAVSLAMLGFAAGGLVVRRKIRRTGAPIALSGAPGAPDASELPDLAAFAAAATCIAIAIAVRLPVDPTALFDALGDQALLVLIGLALAVPFTLLGTVVCAALDVERERIGMAYAATFLGGAAGALVCLASLEMLGAARTCAVLAALPLLAAAAPRQWTRGPFLAAVVLVVAVFAVPGRVLPLESRKHFPKIPPERVLDVRENAFSHVTFYDNPERHGLWAMPPTYAGPLPRSVGIAIDSWAITSILERTGGPDDARFLAVFPPAIAYVGATPGFTALVIGAGGGVDVLGALEAGASHVDAVEINPLIVDAVRSRFREFSGDLYGDPRVTAVAAEGRHFVETTDARYDRIVLSGVDTFAATEAGAFALSENYLYTTEAVRAFLGRLEPSGVLALTRWWFEPPRQTLRLAATIAEVLGDAARGSLFIARAERNSLVLVKNGPFTPAEVETLLAACGPRGAVPVLVPGGAANHPLFEQVLDAAGRAELFASYPYRVEPTTDERPFFFENARLGNVFRTQGDWIHDRVSGQVVLCVTLIALLLASLPLFWLGGAAGAGSRLARVRIFVPFLLLGFAYVAVEIPLMQRLALLLGHPVYAVAVVLVAMLVGSGAGSALAPRIEADRAAAAAMAAAILVLLIPVFSYDLLVDATAGASTNERALAVVLFLVLPALAMGLPFPSFIRGLGAHDRELVSVAWLANGIGAAVGGPAAVMISMEAGFSTTLCCAVGAYVLAALTAMRGGQSLVTVPSDCSPHRT